MIFKKVTTRLSDNYQVPCLDGIAGTWWVRVPLFPFLGIIVFLCDRSTVPLCFAITNFPDAVCPLFPPELPCECPIRAGTYFSSNTQVAFDEQWLTLDGGVAVSLYFSFHILIRTDTFVFKIQNRATTLAGLSSFLAAPFSDASSLTSPWLQLKMQIFNYERCAFLCNKQH